MILSKSLIAGALFAVAVPAAALAGQPVPVTLAPLAHETATLVIVDANGEEHSYTPEDIEAMGSYQMVTRTPWREVSSTFEGGLLQDLLAAHGLDSVDAIRVTAENDFQTVLERKVWETVPVLLATRVDGQPHSRRTRGPIHFVVDEDDYAGSGVVAERHLVWMAARIEPLQ